MSVFNSGALGLDVERLSIALDGGIGHLKHTIPAMLPRGERLRHPICGLAATSLYLHLKDRRYKPELVITRPNLPFDEHMTHVFIAVPSGTAEHVVDPTYSQFLSYVNLHPYYEAIVKSGLMPAEIIAVFDMQNRNDFTQNLAHIAAAFQALDPYRAAEKLHQFRIASGELSDADQATIHAAFNAIWDPTNIEEFTPDPYVLEQAKTVATYMLKKLVNARGE